MPIGATAASLPAAQTSAVTPSQRKLTTLKTVLKGVKSSLKGLPPIREQTSLEYEEIMSDLTHLANLLQTHAVEEHPWSLPYSINNVARAIEQQTGFIRERQDVPRIDQLAMAQDDVEAVLKCYRRIGALFQQLQADISLGIWDVLKEQHMDTRLKDLCPAYDAYHDAALPTSAATRTGCTKDTRVDLLDTIQRWARQEDAPKIFWLNGMAGTGKTTIAYTLCEMLQKASGLGASFFCSRNSPDCRDVNRMVPTIAYQLCRYSNAYRKALYDALRNDPDAAKRKIDKQFEALISKPLAKMGNAMPTDVVVVIDALDEFADVDGAQSVLNMLLGRADSLPIKFFVSSRPEPTISDRMNSSSGAMRSILRLHDIEKSLVQADIHVYLTEALSSIHTTPVEIRQLAESSGSLFIFAATAVRYITLNKGLVDYKQRLRVVLKLHPSRRNNNYKGIDELYSTVLSNALDANNFDEEEIVPRQWVLWTVVCAREPLTMTGIAELLGVLDIEAVQRAILSLQSVLHVPRTTGVVSVLHASFPDFLLSKDRAGPFYCNKAFHESYLASCCFKLMDRSLRFNICGLESSYQFDRDVIGLQDRVSQNISTGLFYSCRYWGEHLTSNPLPTPLISLLEAFLHTHLLFWMEVLNLKQRIGYGEKVLSQVIAWLLTKNNFTKLRDFTYDARNFVTTFTANPVSQSTPHIYVSVLPFTSKQSHVRRAYLPRTRGLIQIEGAVTEGMASFALATWVVGSPVRSITLSSDGKRIASGSGLWLSSGEINIWDVSSGARITGPLKGHNRPVSSVAFSPDGTRVASGSVNFTIRFWDTLNGNPIGDTLCGHAGGVRSLAFSPDGTCLASGSEDRTIRTWDTRTGTAIGEAYRGHKDVVASISFSPNGEHLASGSWDCTIRVWNWRTGVAVRGPIEGHNDSVRSVAYSSDGRRLVSGSRDCSIRVWDMPSGMLLVSPFEGHTKTVTSVSFSPDGTQIVSGSDDLTIRVWEANSGNLLAGPLEGHGGLITSVLFIMDGTRILSGSNDGTIRVWDARHATKDVTGSSGHTSGICSIALSPDGARVASGSEDRTVCVWDTHNGALVAGPFTGYTDGVNSVVFSSDGARIVSGSQNGSLCTRDAYTGALLAGPIRGHSRPVRSVAISPDGRYIASGSDDCTIRLWNSHTGASVIKPLEGRIGFTSISFSPNGTRLVSSSSEGSVRMWDPRNGSVRMWDPRNGTPLWTFNSRTWDVRCVVFSPDGTQVTFGSSDSCVRVLDVYDGAVLYRMFTSHVHRITSVAFSPDGARIVSGSEDRTVYAWELESGKAVAGPLKGHSQGVSSVAFSSDGARIVSGSLDATIRFWDTAAATQSNATTFYDLSINSDGWLTGLDSQLLLWVPSELRHDFALPTPSNPIIIKGNCSTSIHHSTLLLGGRWHECFHATPPPAF